MVKDEAWSWFWSEGEQQFYVRRSDATLDGIPDSAVNYGVAEARANGTYIDFAIPSEAVHGLDIDQGEEWRFTAELDRISTTTLDVPVGDADVDGVEVDAVPADADELRWYVGGERVATTDSDAEVSVTGVRYDGDTIVVAREAESHRDK